MGPAFEVQWHDGGLTEGACSDDPFFSGERQMMRAHLGHARCTHEQHGDLDRKTLRNLCYAFVPHRVARYVDARLRLLVHCQHESGHGTAIAVHGTMARGCPGDADPSLQWGCDVDRFPGSEADRRATESCGTGGCRDDLRRARQHRRASMTEMAELVTG